MKKRDDFEVRRKGIETVFDILFFLGAFDVLGYVLFKVLYILGITTFDVVSFTEIIVSIILCGMMFVCTRLAHKGYLTAGIFGIIVALFYLIFGGLFLKILGVLLLCDSILYIFKYKNNDKNENKNEEKKLIISYISLGIILFLVLIFTSSLTVNNYTAKVGQTLKTREFYKYNIKALSNVEEYSINDSFLYEGDFVKLRVSIENLEKKLNIRLTNVEFSLLDSNKKELYSENVNVCFSYLEDCIQSEEIQPNTTKEGNLYFYDYKDGQRYMTDFSKMNKIKYLKVMVFVDSKTDKDYYLELN